MRKNSLSGAAVMAVAMVAGLGSLSGGGSSASIGDVQASASKAKRADASKVSPGKTVNQRKLATAFNSGSGTPWHGTIRRPGWSVATDRRRAKKARAVAKHRARST